jgi:hypothetical protein
MSFAFPINFDERLDVMGIPRYGFQSAKKERPYVVFAEL